MNNKVAVAMSFQSALANKFKSKLVRYGIEFEERKVWQDIDNTGFRKLLEVQYVMDKDYVAILDMNDALMDNEKTVHYWVRENV